MPKTMNFHMEVSGCPTTCMHCWANGGTYRGMPMADIAWVLAQGQEFCIDNGLAFVPYPFHELLAHPDFTQILPQFAALDPEAYEPIPTPGVPLANREDWRTILAAIKAIGTQTLWFTFHGVGEVHDRAVNRRGAFEETCLAVNRAHEAGLR
ncbi:MAG: hypothetical protein P1S60_12255 [Anaerolineae bacterium]|nr:hypothetical protein [Anaerolineae bacterium]